MTSALRDQGQAVVQRRPLQAPFEGATVLVLSDEAALCESARVVLGDHGYAVKVASMGQGGAALAAGEVDVILLDASQGLAPATGALTELRNVGGSAAIVAVCDPAAIERMAEVLAEGALDFIVRPIEAVAHRTLATVNQALRAARMGRDVRRLTQRLSLQQAQTGFVGCSPLHRRLLTVISRASEGDATTLIEGRPGSGKTSVAHAIQRSSRRSHAPFVERQGEGLTSEMLEAALRETQRGALLIEDIDRMPAETQSRLVRYLKDRPEGSAGAHARLLATTSARLPELVARGTFREDLYYRLNVMPIVVPSLAERRDDIAILANHFLKQAADSTGVAQRGFTPAAMSLLETNAWPQNVAQLQNAVQRAHALAGQAAIDRAHLLGAQAGVDTGPVRTRTPTDPEEQDDEVVDESAIRPFKDEEKRLLTRALRATKGNVRRAAQLLRIGRATLYRKIQSYKLRLH